MRAEENPKTGFPSALESVNKKRASHIPTVPTAAKLFAKHSPERSSLPNPACHRLQAHSSIRKD